MIVLKPEVSPRVYQQVLAVNSTKSNSLVVLPTGLGKTLISLLVALHRLKLYPNSKILILAPTRPLVNQHMKSFHELTDAQADDMVVFTGQVKPTERADEYQKAKIIFSTPQGLENDILSSRIHLRDVSLLVFDEAHRATGDYSYVWVAKQYMKQATQPLILGLTASPGSDKATIQEVVDNLSISQIEYRELTSADVAPYVQETKLEFVDLDLPEPLKEIHVLLQKAYIQRLHQLKNAGFLQGLDASRVRKTQLLMFMARLQKEIAQQQFTPEIATGISVGAQALKISHAVELIETQGVGAVSAYFKSMLSQAKVGKTKAVVAVCQDPLIRLAIHKAAELADLQIEHPKMKTLQLIVNNTLKKNEHAKIIIFSQYRDTLKTICEKINEIPMADAKMFVGQAKKLGTGMSQREQLAMLEDFGNGLFNVVCMSSVGEEGLDIPSVDLVIFFEPIPSAIRTIQRRGRTGRHDEGRVIVLCTKGTRDVAYRWVAYQKEKNMYGILEEVKEAKRQIKIAEFDSAKNVAQLSESLSKSSTQLNLSTESVSPSDAQNIATGNVSMTAKAIAKNVQNEKDVELESPSIDVTAPNKSGANSYDALSSVASKSLSQNSTVAATSESSASNSVKIYADHREKGSDVLKTLFEMPLELSLEQLAIGDYVLSRDVVVEFKRVPDFVDSILDGRLLEQLKMLKESVHKPIVIVEGEESLFGVRNVHPNAIYGMISTITISYGIPLLLTRNAVDTANLLFMIARREQQSANSSFSPHASNKPKTIREQQEYIVSAIPDVGLALARRLLERFGSVEGVVRASLDELSSIDGIGKQKSATIRTILQSLYR